MTQGQAGQKRPSLCENAVATPANGMEPQIYTRVDAVVPSEEDRAATRRSLLLAFLHPHVYQDASYLSISYETISLPTLGLATGMLPVCFG